jgi:hypothetical protein
MFLKQPVQLHTCLAVCFCGVVAVTLCVQTGRFSELICDSAQALIMSSCTRCEAVDIVKASYLCCCTSWGRLAVHLACCFWLYKQPERWLLLACLWHSFGLGAPAVWIEPSRPSLGQQWAPSGRNTLWPSRPLGICRRVQSTSAPHSLFHSERECMSRICDTQSLWGALS